MDRISINSSTKEDYKGRYTRESEELEGTEQLGKAQKEGDSITATAFTIEQKYRAEKERRDRWNRVWTTALTLGFRAGFNVLKANWELNHNPKQNTQPDVQQNTQTSTKQNPPPLQKNDIPKSQGNPTPEPSTNIKDSFDLNQSISEFKYSNDVRLHTFGADATPVDPLSKNASIDGFAISFVKDGKQYGISIGESTTGFTNGHVQTLMGQDISNMPLREVLQKMIDNNPDGWNAYLNAKGIDPASNPSLEEILARAVQDGDVYGQHAMTGWRKLEFDFSKIVPKENASNIPEVSEIPEAFVKKAREIYEQQAKEIYEQQAKEIYEQQNIVETSTESIASTAGTIGKATWDGVKQGAEIGAVGSAVADVGETIKPTERETKGTFEERNPNLNGNSTTSQKRNVNRKLEDSDDGKKLGINRDDDDGR